MTRIPGIERRKKLKDEIAQFESFVKVMRGESVEKQTEKALEKKIILNLKLHGFYVYKTASHPGVYDYNLQFNKAGIADLIVIGGPNKVAFLEVKMPKGRQSYQQKEFEALCVMHGVKYAVVRSVGEAIKICQQQTQGGCNDKERGKGSHGDRVSP